MGNSISAGLACGGYLYILFCYQDLVSAENLAIFLYLAFEVRYPIPMLIMALRFYLWWLSVDLPVAIGALAFSCLGVLYLKYRLSKDDQHNLELDHAFVKRFQQMDWEALSSQEQNTTAQEMREIIKRLTGAGGYIDVWTALLQEYRDLGRRYPRDFAVYPLRQQLTWFMRDRQKKGRIMALARSFGKIDRDKWESRRLFAEG